MTILAFCAENFEEIAYWDIRNHIFLRVYSWNQKFISGDSRLDEIQKFFVIKQFGAKLTRCFLTNMHGTNMKQEILTRHLEVGNG